MNFYSATSAQLAAYLRELGENPAKAAIIFREIYQNNNTLAHLPLKAALCAQLAADFSLDLPQLVVRNNAATAAKFLFRLHDGQLIEAVLMRQKFGSSLCISTQVGCNMACAFCQSGRFKKVRSLTAGEMTAQILAVQACTGVPITNVVLMGIGEPLDNFAAVMDFLAIITDPHGLALGRRHITLSTCGLAPQIIDYAHNPNHCLLAVSLHAAQDDLRSQLMPINRRYPLAQLSQAIDSYLASANKKVMLEYTLLRGVNDSPAHAQALIDWIAGRKLHVNLIGYNATQNLGFAPSTAPDARAFFELLQQNHITTTMRREFGSDLNAACGQLRSDQLARQNL